MKLWLFAAGTVIIASVLGCDNKPAGKPKSGSGVEVNAPGVHVEGGGGKGVEVEAPGVEVHTPPAK